jgi:hypothetical protein
VLVPTIDEENEAENPNTIGSGIIPMGHGTIKKSE